ncbi:hypothetical protein J2Y03_001054 [Neobacillus niacini]|uniref:hypothetical protein n=1 Tax=Neobacillus niacini TaxID=86668 RepID=UPI002854B8DE|nr:hypothetical protein [Neobacillus niacini]MDR7076051.1 hypothetical protein [Neobacillus niacini]
MEEGYSQLFFRRFDENLTQLGAIVVPINDMKRLFNHEQVKSIDILKSIDYRGEIYRVIGAPWNILEYPLKVDDLYQFFILKENTIVMSKVSILQNK